VQGILRHPAAISPSTAFVDSVGGKSNKTQDGDDDEVGESEILHVLVDLT
jgi:hypothetical protein